MKRIHITLISLLLATGCGGGGEGDASQSPVSSTPPAPPPVVKTKDLVSNSSFDFSSNYNLRVVIPAKPDGASDYFINVCTNYDATKSIINDYTSCKVRTYLQASSQTFDIELSDSERDLVAQIWPMTQGAEATSYYFTATGDDDTWQLKY